MDVALACVEKWPEVDFVGQGEDNWNENEFPDLFNVGTFRLIRR